MLVAPSEGSTAGASALPYRGGPTLPLKASISSSARPRKSDRSQSLVEEGFEAVLARKYNSNSARRRIFDGAAEAKLIALTPADAWGSLVTCNVKMTPGCGFTRTAPFFPQSSAVFCIYEGEDGEETGERSGGIWKNLFGGSRRKIAKNKCCYANTFTTPLKDAVERR